MQTVPLTNEPNQSMKIKLSIDGKNRTLKLTFRYNEEAEYWVMGVADSDGNSLIDSVPLVPGDYPASNILAQHAYLGIGSAYIINAGNVAGDRPDDSNLGADWLLVWGDTP